MRVNESALTVQAGSPVAGHTKRGKVVNRKAWTAAVALLTLTVIAGESMSAADNHLDLPPPQLSGGNL
jgi:hypothetical protein